MRRALLTGNGRMFIAIDKDYAIKELYFPLIGQANHIGSGGIRFVIGEKDNFSLIDKSQWRAKECYLKETLCSSVSLSNSDFRVILKCYESVDFACPIFVRRISVRNLADFDRTISIYSCQHFLINEQGLITHKAFDEQRRLAMHYAGWKYLSSTFVDENDKSAVPIVDFYSSELPDELFELLSGRYRQEQLREMTYLRADISLEAFQEKRLYFIIIAATSYDETLEYFENMIKECPEKLIERTCAYWRLWSTGTNINFGNIPARVVEGFKRSLLTIRMYVNENGSIVTNFGATNSELQSQGFMHTFSSAISAHAFDLAGLPEPSRLFYSTIKREFSKFPRIFSRYNPDCSVAEICLSNDSEGSFRLADSAILLWGLWRHYFRFRDIEYICSLWSELIKPVSERMIEELKPPSYLPPVELDVWNRKTAITLFTSCLAQSAVLAARNFAICFGEQELADRYSGIAETLKQSIEKYFFSEKLNRFTSAIYPLGGNRFEQDSTIDASMLGLVKFGTFPAEDARVITTMSVISDELWVKTPAGGLTRFEKDFPVGDDVSGQIASGILGYPSFVATFWLAQFLIAKAKTPNELKYAIPILEWAMSNATSSGFLTDIVNPNNIEISQAECPYILAHAELIITVINYLEKLEKLNVCQSCGQGIYRVRRHWPMQIKLSDILAKYSVPQRDMDELNNLIIFEHNGREVVLSIDLKECIGCSVCMTNCPQNIFVMTEDKAQIDRNNINNCTLCEQCQRACPVGAIRISINSALSNL